MHPNVFEFVTSHIFIAKEKHMAMIVNTISHFLDICRLVFPSGPLGCFRKRYYNSSSNNG
jgi:hypothetical protein